VPATERRLADQRSDLRESAPEIPAFLDVPQPVLEQRAEGGERGQEVDAPDRVGGACRFERGLGLRDEGPAIERDEPASRLRHGVSLREPRRQFELGVPPPAFGRTLGMSRLGHGGALLAPEVERHGHAHPQLPLGKQALLVHVGGHHGEVREVLTMRQAQLLAGAQELLLSRAHIG
jgi:hypothetical protein